MATDYVNRGGKPVIYWFLRDTDGQRFMKKIEGFRPHAWSSEPEGREAQPTEDIFGRKVYSWVARLPSEIGGGRSRFAYTCEADILFPLRALIDYGVYCGIELHGDKFKAVHHHSVDPVVGLFDFEYFSPKEIMPMPTDPRWPMVVNQWGLTSDDVIRVNILNFTRIDQAPDGITPEMIDPEEVQRRHNLWESVKELSVTLEDGTVLTYPVEVTVCYDEREMHVNFAKASEDFEVDVWSGYNSNNYDWPMFFLRGQQFRITHVLKRHLSPLNSAWCRWNERMKKWDLMIKGRNILDLGDIYKKYIKPAGERTSYDLKLVVKDECGFVYDDWGDRIRWGYINDPVGLLEYCIRDVVALKLLNDRCQLVPYIDILRRVAGTLWEKSLSNKVLVDTTCLRLSDKPLPTGYKGDKQEKAKGALVIAPPPGLHEWTVLLDLKSIYPSVIIAYNLSPETKVMPGDDYDPDDVARVPIVDDYGNVTREVLFRKSPQGIIAKACEHLMALREEYREIGRKLEAAGQKDTKERKVLHHQETVAKFIACSINGVLAYPGFRLFDQETFNCVTSITRSMIWKIREVLEPLGYEVIYGDTDSVFVKLKAKTKEEAIAECPELEKIAQDHVYAWCESIGASGDIEVKLEFLFDALIFKKKAKGDDPAKKRYGAHYIMKDYMMIEGFKIQGLEPKSSAAAWYTREKMTNWLYTVLGDKDVDGANAALRDAYHAVGDVKDIGEIGIPRGLHKRPYDVYMGGGLQPWAIGCMGAMEVFGKRFAEDDKPKLIYTLPTHKYPYDSICITDETEMWPGVRIDWKKQKQKILRDKFTELLEAVGHTWSEIEHDLRQTGLGEFTAPVS